MATKGTTQYNVWKAKYQAALTRKSQPSLFDEPLTTQTKPSKPGNTLQYFESNCPKGLDLFIWKKAAYRATKGGSDVAAFSAVRAIYNNYIRREEQERINHFNFCCARAENELLLEEMFA